MRVLSGKAKQSVCPLRTKFGLLHLQKDLTNNIFIIPQKEMTTKSREKYKYFHQENIFYFIEIFIFKFWLLKNKNCRFKVEIQFSETFTIGDN